MKNLGLWTGLFSLIAVVPVQAQGYYYPANPTPSYAVQPVKRTPALKHFSLGMDYVVGSLSIIDKDFEIENPLPGGSTYHGKTSNFEDNIDSLNGNIGWRPFKYLGLEAFYQKSLSDNQVKFQEHYASDPRFAQAEYNVKYSAYGIDLVAFIPVLSRLELLATAGVAKYEFKADVKFNAYSDTTANLVSSNPLKMDESKTAFRYGGGAQLWLTERLAFRMMYRYTSIGGTYFDDISEISLGVRYNF